MGHDASVLERPFLLSSTDAGQLVLVCRSDTMRQILKGLSRPGLSTGTASNFANNMQNLLTPAMRATAQGLTSLRGQVEILKSRSAFTRDSQMQNICKKCVMPRATATAGTVSNQRSVRNSEHESS